MKEKSAVLYYISKREIDIMDNQEARNSFVASKKYSLWSFVREKTWET